MDRNINAQKRAEETKIIFDETDKKIYLEGKLLNCISQNTEENEVYVVEGVSAGGTAKSARNCYNQAILTLRGKILNVLRATQLKILKNKEIKSILSTIGIFYNKIERKFTVLEPKFGKIIIAADADPDGQHIKLLFLTLILHLCPSLFDKKKIFIANTPLFKLSYGNKFKFCFDKTELNNFIKIHKLTKYSLQRFKGLGEMNPSQLRETIFLPENRSLTQVSIEDVQHALKTMTDLMGTDSDYRK